MAAFLEKFKKFSAKDTIHECLFGESKLGLNVVRGPQGEPLVEGVIKGGEGERLGIQPGDVIVSVNGGGAPTYDNFVATVPALERPLMLTLKRGAPVASNAKSGAAKTGKGSKGQAPPLPISDAEKLARREAALKAAEERDKAWQGRLKGKNPGGGGASSKRSQEPLSTVNDYEASESEATKQMIDLCKRKEEETARQLGYNPYAPKLTTTSEARVAVAGAPGSAASPTGGSSPTRGRMPGSSLPASPTTPASSAAPPSLQAAGAAGAAGAAALADGVELPVADEAWHGEAEELEGEIDVALGLLMSHEPAASKDAVTTVSKLLTNLITRAAGDAKFRRVKLANATFQKRVGALVGGMEVLTAAGFELCSDDDGAYLHYPFELAPLPLRLYLCAEKLRVAEATLASSADG